MIKTLNTLLEIEGLLAASDGRGIRVALVDGPVDRTHPDLEELDLHELGDTRGCVIPASPGCGHGTFVAGILGARRGGPAPGICPASTLLVRPIFCEHPDFNQCPLVTVGELAKAVREAVDAGAQVVNLSVGLSGGVADPTPLYAAYDHARTQGALVVVAAGNHGTGEASPLLLHPWPIGVAATDHRGQPAASVAPAIADRVVLAPGVEVTSTAPGKGYRTMSGTSAAAPFVAGTLALLRERYPQAAPAALRAAVLGEGEPGPRPRLLDGEASRRRLQSEIESTNRETLPMTDASPLDFSSTDSGHGEAALDPASNPVPTPLLFQDQTPPATVVPQNGGTETDFVYAIGHVKAAFPSLDVEKEFLRVAKGMNPPADPSDFHTVLSADSGRYLADYLCWVLLVGNVDTYILRPRAPEQMDDLIGAIAVPSGAVEPPYTTIIGPLGPPAPASMCRGLEAPMVLVNQVYYFDYKTLYDELQGKGIETESIQAILKAMEMKPNAGISDRDRALNYLAFRYPDIYKRTGQMRATGQGATGQGATGSYFLKSIETRPSGVQGTRRLIDVIFNYQNAATQEESAWYCSVDVSGQFPFLNTALRPFVPEPSV